MQQKFLRKQNFVDKAPGRRPFDNKILFNPKTILLHTKQEHKPKQVSNMSPSASAILIVFILAQLGLAQSVSKYFLPKHFNATVVRSKSHLLLNYAQKTNSVFLLIHSKTDLLKTSSSFLFVVAQRKFFGMQRMERLEGSGG